MQKCRIQNAKFKCKTQNAEELGPKRRRELLRQFGGLQALARAGIDDIERVKGISRQLAEAIYEHFHAD